MFHKILLGLILVISFASCSGVSSAVKDDSILDTWMVEITGTSEHLFHGVGFYAIYDKRFELRRGAPCGHERWCIQAPRGVWIPSVYLQTDNLAGVVIPLDECPQINVWRSNNVQIAEKDPAAPKGMCAYSLLIVSERSEP